MDEALTTFTYTLDALGRTTAVLVSLLDAKTFEYDGLSRNTRAVDHMTETAVTVDFYYDSLGRVVEEVSPYFVTQTEFTSYPATECAYPDGRVVDSFYDVLYRRNVVSQPGAGGSAADIAEWRFYGPSRVADMRLGNGVLATHLNSSGRSAVQKPLTPLPAWGNGCSDRLGYDGAGRLISKRYFLECPTSSSSSSRSSVPGIPSSSSGPRSILYVACDASSMAPSSSLSSKSSALASSASPSSSSCLPCLSPELNCLLLAGFVASYDKASNKLFERHLHAECRSFLYPSGKYDSADRLLAYRRGLLAEGGNDIAQDLSLPGVDSQREYNLDKTGNWVDEEGPPARPATQWVRDCQPGQQSRETNALNQVTEVNGQEVKQDAKGNLTKDGMGLELTYDPFNRLVLAKRNGSTVGQYVYDALDRRVRKTASGRTITYFYDGEQVIEERDDALEFSILRQYVWGQYIDELIQQREYEHSGTPGQFVNWYPLSDLLYRTVALTDERLCSSSSGAPGGGPGGSSQIDFVEVYDTDAYGRTRIYSARGPDGRWFTDDDVVATVPKCRYLYTGREYDAETGLYYYRARYYHPELGRFVSRDPLLYGAGSMNLYEYVRGNPLIQTDPDGAVVHIIGGGVAGGLLGAGAYLIQVAITGEAFSASKLATYTIAGAVSGALAAATFGASLAITSGAGFTAFQSGVVASTAAGLVGGAAEGAISTGGLEYLKTGDTRKSLAAAGWGALKGGALGAVGGASGGVVLGRLGASVWGMVGSGAAGGAVSGAIGGGWEGYMSGEGVWRGAAKGLIVGAATGAAVSGALWGVGRGTAFVRRNSSLSRRLPREKLRNWGGIEPLPPQPPGLPDPRGTRYGRLLMRTLVPRRRDYGSRPGQDPHHVKHLALGGPEVEGNIVWVATAINRGPGRSHPGPAVTHPRRGVPYGTIFY